MKYMMYSHSSCCIVEHVQHQAFAPIWIDLTLHTLALCVTIRAPEQVDGDDLVVFHHCRPWLLSPLCLLGGVDLVVFHPSRRGLLCGFDLVASHHSLLVLSCGLDLVLSHHSLLVLSCGLDLVLSHHSLLVLSCGLDLVLSAFFRVQSRIVSDFSARESILD